LTEHLEQRECKPEKEFLRGSVQISLVNFVCAYEREAQPRTIGQVLEGQTLSGLGIQDDSG
jgi:hypothetical protein